MIDRLVGLSARHRTLVLAVTAVCCAAGLWSMTQLPVDALPDVADPQIIVHAEWDRSPELVEAAVTAPIVSALASVPHVRTVRGESEYGSSLVHVLLDDRADVVAARARTLQALDAIRPKLPPDAVTAMAPEATSLGWVFQYALVDPSGAHDLAALRALQESTIKPALGAIPGVAEVATVGGLTRQYEVELDAGRLRARDISVARIVEALSSAGRDTASGVLDRAGRETVVRGLSAARGIDDLPGILVATTDGGTPVRVADLANVKPGVAVRRGLADLDGRGETVSGIVIMRNGENALEVIDRVHAKLRQIETSLPAGVAVWPVYDRSELVHRAIGTLERTVLEITAIVSLVIVAFLGHAPSVIVPLVGLPVALLIAFVPLRMLGIGANIMSLGGLAIAAGALVDAAIVMVEQSHKRLEAWEREGRRGDPAPLVLDGIRQVARPAFFALLVIAVSFLPILALTGEAGRLFLPLAAAKSLALLVAALLAITLAPALRMSLTRRTPFDFRPAWLARLSSATLVGTIEAEDRHPVTRRIMRRYEPVVLWTIRHKGWLAAAVVAALLVTVPIAAGLGTEFMPPLDEGTLLYMPSTMPGLSVSEAGRWLAATDRALAAFPEVAHVLGKAGHADTVTDPAPLSMLESVVVLRPESAWRRVPTWYSSWAPSWALPVFRRITPDHISRERLIAEMNDAVTLPGVANAWTMPVRGRIDMLATGFRTPLGIKIAGARTEDIDEAGTKIVEVLRSIPGTRSAFTEASGRASFLDVRWDRDALARSGIRIEDAQGTIDAAIGGVTATRLFVGRERFPVVVRFPRGLAEDPDALGRLPVISPEGGRAVAVADLATIGKSTGPAMLRTEDGFLTGYVYVDTTDSDLAGYVSRADRALREKLTLPAGCSISWGGQYASIATMRRQLAGIIPLTLLAVVVLIAAATRSWAKTLLVLAAVPFSVIGAIAALSILGYHLSVASWVGIVALAGVDAETGVFMLLYLDEAYDRARRSGPLSAAGLTQTVLEGASRRVRPKLMTVATMLFGLLPVLWSTGTGADVMKRIAAPLIGGIITSFVLELLVYPAAYHAWASRGLAEDERGNSLREGAGARSRSS